ncbi:MAG: EVE domain-containing protein [Candidatus Pacebacteria bacterium]|jgi:predicted RNA-binding protein with PUA-like domain|nr:EVE domain-containing protein [Candidatus Paceibacterota bacterium]
MKKRYWIMKCEPKIFSIGDLERAGKYFWDGVRNYQVRNMFRDNMMVGDKALFYHSSTKNVGIVGEMEITKSATPDQTQFDPKSQYFDAKATRDNPRWLGPTVSFRSKFKNLVTLDQIRQNEIFSNLPLVKKGNRLSVMEISKEHYDRLVNLGK